MGATQVLAWLDLTVEELRDHPDLLDRLLADEIVGITVRGMYPADACARVVEGMGRYDDIGTPVMFGHVLGRPLLQDGADVADRRIHLDDAERMQGIYADLFGFDPAGRLTDALAPMLGGREWTAPFEDGRRYNPGNLRIMEPHSCALPAHAGNQFLEGAGRGSGAYLLETVRAFDHLSYFVVIQQPDEGGQLSVFDLMWVDPSEREPGDDGGAFGADPTVGMPPALVLDPGPGDLILFRAGRRFHRVEPLGAGRQRVTYGGFSAPGVDGTSMRCWS